MILRHGDLLLRQIEQLPKGLIKKTGTVLAEGETTGHRHVLIAERKNLVQLYEDDKGQLYFKVEKHSKLTHQEHKTLTIPAGVWVVGKEREFDYYLDSIRQVQD